jgi:DNA-binding FadR family transcriptional regulator
MPDKLEQSALSGPEPLAGEDSGATDGKLASRVARRVEADIIAAGWPIGHMLGSENDLRERYGISRSVLREAVRLLEHHQVGRMRRGPGGGFFVTALDSGPATRAIVIYLEYLGTTVEDLLYARLLLEPLAAGGAARRAGEDDIDALRQALEEERSREWEPGIEAHNSLHPLLAQLSGNPALRLFIDVLTRFTERYADNLRRISKAELGRTQAGAEEAHGKIVESVIAGDADHASNRMARHVEAVADWLGSHQKSNRFTHLNRPQAAASLDLEDAKLSEVLASRIHEEIAYRGWPIGEVLGSEPDLLARYQVSRAALREAVRILEYHSVASMRRGPGGGLVVTVPDPTASIETMALYLDYQKVSVDDLRAVREAIELGCIDRVVARRNEPEVADRLRAALQVDASTPPADINRLSHVLHTELGELSGNPVLALFLRIVTDLAYRHAVTSHRTASGPDISDEEAAAAAGRIHARIVEAILAGDSGLARHRMRRHLEAITAWWH